MQVHLDVHTSIVPVLILLVVQPMSKQQQQSVKQFLTFVSQMEFLALKPKNAKITQLLNANQLQVFLESRNVNGIQMQEFVEIMLVLKLMPH